MNNIYSKKFNSTSNFAKDVLYYLLLLHYQIQVFRCLIDTIISYLVLPLTLFIVPFGSRTFNRVHLHVDHTFKLCLLSFLSESLGNRTINECFHPEENPTSWRYSNKTQSNDRFPFTSGCFHFGESLAKGCTV